MAIEIPVKGNRAIRLDDIIQLSSKQLTKIFEKSPSKTEKQWLLPKTKGIKVKLSPEQHHNVLAYKNKFVQNHTVDSFMQARMVTFSALGLEQTSVRINKNPPEEPPSEEAQRAIIDLVMHATELSKEAEWRGHASLSYSFKGIYNHNEWTVSAVFEGSKLVITSVADTGETAPVTSLIGGDQLQKLQAFRDKL